MWWRLRRLLTKGGRVWLREKRGIEKFKGTRKRRKEGNGSDVKGVTKGSRVFSKTAIRD